MASKTGGFLLSYSPKKRTYKGIEFFTTTGFRWYHLFESIGFNPEYEYQYKVVNPDTGEIRSIAIEFKLDLSSYGISNPIYGFTSSDEMSPQRKKFVQSLKETIIETSPDAIFIVFESFPMNKVFFGEVYDEERGKFIQQNFMFSSECGLAKLPEEYCYQKFVGIPLRNTNELDDHFRNAIRFARVA